MLPALCLRIKTDVCLCPPKTFPRIKRNTFFSSRKTLPEKKSGCYFYYDAGKRKGTVSGNDNRPEVMFVKTSSSFYYAEQKLEIDYRVGQTVFQSIIYFLNCGLLGDLTAFGSDFQGKSIHAFIHQSNMIQNTIGQYYEYTTMIGHANSLVPGAKLHAWNYLTTAT